MALIYGKAGKNPIDSGYDNKIAVIKAVTHPGLHPWPVSTVSTGDPPIPWSQWLLLAGRQFSKEN